jgi:hypothetical protein
MFIGSALKRMELGTVGYGILIGWLLYFLSSIILIEYANKKYPPSQPNFQTNINLSSSGKYNLFQLFCFEKRKKKDIKKIFKYKKVLPETM